jgi:hypothetical protein
MYIIMDVDSNVSSIAFTKDLVVSGKRKMIRVGELEGFGKGDFHYTNLHPAVSCIVKRTKNKYTLLNANDLRVKLLIEEYDQATMVEVFEISSHSDAEKISFLTGDLIPNQTTQTKFSDLFKSIAMSKQYQKWIGKHFTTKESRAHSQVSFNLQSLIGMLGINAPSKVTLDRIIKDVKAINTDASSEPVSIPPTQIDVYPPESPIEQSADLGLDKKSIPALIQEAVTDSETSEPSSSNNLPEASTVESHPKEGLSEHEMQEVWDTYSESKYSYQEVRELLINNGSNTFTERLNTIKPGTPEFLKFARKLVDHLNEPRSHE